ncbi:MAG: hypothetical protein ACUVR1_06550 [Fimbriimonadales bacterium]
MAGILWAAWLALGVWGVASGGRRVDAGKPTRLCWLGDWKGWILALGVASFAPALIPTAPLTLQAALTLLAGAGLLRLIHALDSRAVGHGVVAGLGLIALLLDSLSGGTWARGGALGHGTQAHGIGILYGALALLWGLTVARAWRAIEGNPLGIAVGMGALACWLSWKGLTPAIGWGATATALTLGGMLLRRERDERRRVRLMLQNRVVRIVRRTSNLDMMLAGVALVGLCLLALWLSGIPAPAIPRLGTHAGWQAGIVIVGILPRVREKLGGGQPPPPPHPPRRRGGLWEFLTRMRGRGNRWSRVGATPRLYESGAIGIGIATLALLSGEPLPVLALGMLFSLANTGEALQEPRPRASNLPTRTGGDS